MIYIADHRRSKVKATKRLSMRSTYSDTTLKLIKTEAATHYSNKINEHGPSFQGVDWGSEDGQIIRFKQLTKMIDLKLIQDVIDFGCGYGALLDYLHTNGYQGNYQGFDISAAMIEEAQRLYNEHPNVRFTTQLEHLTPVDYTLVSGVFNVKMGTPEKDWLRYVLRTMEQVYELSRRGFIFNILSAKTPPNRREDDLYYADPEFILNYCRQQFKAQVIVWDDYPLDDFTAFVRLNA